MSEEQSFDDFDEEEPSKDLEVEEMDGIPIIPPIPGVPSDKPISTEIPDIPDMPVIPEVPKTSDLESKEDILAGIPKVPTASEVEIKEPISEEDEELLSDEEVIKEEVLEEELVEEILDEVFPEEIESVDKPLDIDTLETTIEESKDQMKTKPAKKVVTLAIVFTVLSFAMTLAFAFVFNDMYFNWDKVGALKWFPGNFIVEIMVMWILPIVMFFLIIPLYSFFAKMYVRLHKLIKLRRFNYSIVQLKDDPIKFREALGRMIIPLLFLYSIGYWVGTWIFPSDLHHLVPIQMLQYFLYSFLFSPIVVLLAIPLWLLEDSGIIALKRRKEGERKLPDVEGVNNYFHNLYTGSALSIFAVTIVSFIIASIGHFEGGLFGAIAYVFVVLAVESLSFVYLFELFMLRAKKRLLNRIPAKLVDMEPKIVVNLKDVNNDKHEIVDDEEESIDQY